MCSCGAEIILAEVILGCHLSPLMSLQQQCFTLVPDIGTHELFLGHLLLKSSSPCQRIRGFLRCVGVCVVGISPRISALSARLTHLRHI